MQLRAFWQTNQLDEKARLPLTWLEKILASQEQLKRPLSAIYKNLNETKKTGLPWFARMWNKDLGMELKEQDWNRIFHTAHSLTLDNRAQEKNYKIVSRWYRCPVDVGRYNPQGSGECWRCKARRGDLLHIWWECPPVMAFWNSVLAVYNLLEGEHIMNNPQVTLLSILPGTESIKNKDPLKFLLMAARVVIPRYWKTSDIPSMREWYTEVEFIRMAEKIIAYDKGFGESYLETWKGWEEKCKEDEFRRMLAL